MRPFEQLRGFFIRQPRLSPGETSRAKDMIVLFAYLGLAQFLPLAMQLRVGHSTPLIELTPVLVLSLFLTLAMATDHFERNPRDRVLVVLGAVGWYFVFGLPFAELGLVDVTRALHMDVGSGVSLEFTGRAIAGLGSLNVVSTTSRLMLKGRRRSLDMQLV